MIGKFKSRNKKVSSTEGGSQLNPKSDSETHNDWNANENKTVHYCIKWDNKLIDDVSVDQINGTKYKAACTHQSSLPIETKLDCFIFFLTQELMKECLALAKSEEMKARGNDNFQF